MWDDLKRAAGQLEPFKALEERLAAAEADVDIAGLHGSARALLLARLFEEREAPFLLIVADPVQARDMVEDLTIFGLGGAMFYPGDEMLPYDYHDPDRNLTGMQMRALEVTRTVRFRGLNWKEAVKFSATAPGDYRRNLKRLSGDIEKEVSLGVRVFLFCSSDFQRERAEDLLSDVSIDIDFMIGNLSSGFKWRAIGALFLSESEIFGRYHRPFHLPKAGSRSLTYDHSHFKPGDFVVHVNHGIGRYMGLRVLDIEGGRTECLDLR